MPPLKTGDAHLVNHRADMHLQDLESLGRLGYVIFSGLYDFAALVPFPDERSTSSGTPGPDSGDLGYFDEDSHLHITGRVKELIIRGGVNISPLEIDAILIEHPLISEAGTIGVPHPIYGEEVVAYVACLPGETVRTDDILGHCAAKLPEAKRPKAIYVLDDLPKNARGKLDRAALRAHHKEHFASEPEGSGMKHG